MQFLNKNFILRLRAERANFFWHFAYFCPPPPPTPSENWIDAPEQHIPSTKSEVPYGQGPLKGTGRFMELDALSCYLSLILKHSDTKMRRKNPIVSQHLEGARTCCAPAWIRHWFILKF